ncbi:MAG TPA: hypothetical protein DC006_03440 [Prevotellaceae bacterium]|nr:hypothetical protein [Prevotellaceae bacterium]
MKRKLTLLALALASLPLWADPVGREAARETARLFLENKGIDMKTQAPAHRAPRKGAEGRDNSYYYVFNAGDDQGYVIVSGDDRTEEILGYVDHGTYSEHALPAHMKAWLRGYADQIQFLTDHNIQGSTASQRAKARRRMRSTRHAVPVLMSTTWNQGDPYNSKCPMYYKGDGTTGQPATGCVATALAQVMNFYKHPSRIRKNIPPISNTYTLDNGAKKTVTTKAVRVGTKIDWDNMADNYTGSETQEQKDAVANLMYYVGQSVGMGYGASSGAGFGSNVSSAFIDYFGYDDGAYTASRTDYTIDGWFDLIYNEIASGHPVGFAGWSTGGGHSFVLDGFDGESLFHLNWGWGGGSDGWFLLGVLNPGDNSGIGASTSSDGYSLGQTALLNLRLPDAVKADPTACLTINDVAIDGASIKGNYINWTGSSGRFHACIVYQKEDSTLAPVGGKYETLTLNPNNYYTKTYSVSGLLPQGTWRLSPASKLSNAKTWRAKYNMRDTYIEAVVDAQGKTTLRTVTPNHDISIDTIKCIGTGQAGDQQEIQVRFTNHGDEYLRELRLFASTTGVKADGESRAMVALRKGESGTYSFFYKPAEAGTYNLWICSDSDGNEVVGTGQMTIAGAGQGSKPKLAVASFRISNAQNGTVYGKRLCGTVAVRNKDSKPFAGKVVLQMWRQAQGSSTAWTYKSSTVNLEIEPAHTCLAAFDFDGLEYGPTYRIQVKVYGEDIEKGGLWEHGWECKEGILAWKENGALAAVPSRTAFMANSNYCALLIDQANVRRVSPNKNPNTIYAVSEGTAAPTGLDGHNLVTGDSAEAISLTSGYAYCVPHTFTAKRARLAHTFPQEGYGKGWQSVNLPFECDSLTVDGKSVALDDPLNHFWIYEYAWNDDNGEPVFAPAGQLRANTPYLVAADSSMAGHTIEFHGRDVTIQGTSATKSVVSSREYTLRGTTLAESMSGIYTLNSDGTAFEYSDDAVTTTPTGAYFTTTLDAGTRPASIALPRIPKSLDTAVQSPGAVTRNGDGSLFTITGQRVGRESLPRNGSLAPGVYVSKGRKILVR